MSVNLEQLRREDCRFSVRAYLAGRPSIAQTADTICRRMRKFGDGDFTETEVEDALSFLSTLTPPQAVSVREAIGSTLYWRITAAGTLAHERGE